MSDFRSKPRKRRPKEPIKPDALLLFKYQVLELLDTAYPTLWAWMRDGKFPLSIQLGPEGGRSSKIAWIADEVYAWIASRPRRKIGRMPRKGEYEEQAPSERRPPKKIEEPTPEIKTKTRRLSSRRLARV